MTTYRKRGQPTEKIQVRIASENAAYLADYAHAQWKSNSLVLDEMIAFFRRYHPKVEQHSSPLLTSNPASLKVQSTPKS